MVVVSLVANDEVHNVLKQGRVLGPFRRFNRHNAIHVLHPFSGNRFCGRTVSAQSPCSLANQLVKRKIDVTLQTLPTLRPIPYRARRVSLVSY